METQSSRIFFVKPLITNKVVSKGFTFFILFFIMKDTLLGKMSPKTQPGKNGRNFRKSPTEGILSLNHSAIDALKTLKLRCYCTIHSDNPLNISKVFLFFFSLLALSFSK